MEPTVSLYNQIKENCPDFPEIKFEERSIDLLDVQVTNIKESLINKTSSSKNNLLFPLNTYAY